MFAALKDLKETFVLDMSISINHKSFTAKTTLFLVASSCLYGPLLKRKAEFCSDLLTRFALWIYCL